jgi:hypothetical protein
LPRTVFPHVLHHQTHSLADKLTPGRWFSQKWRNNARQTGPVIARRLYITKSKIILFTFLQKMSDDDKYEYEEAMRNPYRDDPVWEDWHSQAYGVQGGLDDTSSSESEDETINMQPVTLPSTCVCQHCRLVLTL